MSGACSTSRSRCSRIRGTLFLLLAMGFTAQEAASEKGDTALCGGDTVPKYSLPTPSNVSVVLTSWQPPAVRVDWYFPSAADPSSDATSWPLTGFELTYRPLNARYRVVHDLPPEQRSLTLKPLVPGIEYQVKIAPISVGGGPSKNSSTVRFLSPDVRNESTSSLGDPSLLEEEASIPPHFTVREEEVVIVVMVLAVWVFVIVLFFNKWGKIRMLEPYQPQYHSHPQVPKPPRLPIPDTLAPPMDRLNVDFGSQPTYSAFSRPRPRQNSVFVGSPYRSRSGSVLSEPRMPRKVKSAEDIKSLVIQVTSNRTMHQSTAL